MQSIAPNVFVETGYPGLNVGVIVTEKGAVCIDSPPCPTDAQEWVSRVQSAFELPIRYLILTDAHPDRTVMSGAFHTRIIAHKRAQDKIAGYGTRFPGPVLESITTRYDLLRKELNGISVDHPQISFCDQATIRLGELDIDLLHMPSATPGSLWVYLKDDQVVFTGDTVVIDQHPPLSEAMSKSWLDSLVHLRRERFKVNVIVPGRGSLCDKAATLATSEFVRMARRRVQSLYRAGRPRADTTTLIPEFIPAFPHTDIPREWLQKQLKSGLDHIYDELKQSDSSRERDGKLG
jgi:glyoxylase-like metal-dependent hydrolase (beta-lactamase superfamily II)